MSIKNGSSKERVMQAIIEYITRHGYPPTIREIGQMTNLKSTSSVIAHVHTLLKEGRLETDVGDNSPRALRVPGYKFVKREEQEGGGDS